MGMGTPTAGSAPPAQDAVLAGRDPGEPFEVFYRCRVDGVYRALAVALDDSDLAREATDEAMLRAYARWARVGALDNPGGWVFRSA
jgi:RNA polymerase sigma-70 factor (ECF subfamily)